MVNSLHCKGIFLSFRLLGGMAYSWVLVLMTTCLAALIYAEDEISSLAEASEQSGEPNYDAMQSLLANMYLSDLLEGNDDVVEQYSMYDRSNYKGNITI